MNIQILSTSIREGRKSHRVALYIQNWIKENTSHETSIIDLKELNFPLFDERYKFLENPDEKVTQFRNEMNDADALFIVTPEYNGSFPASLKNVIDLLFEEWQNKPISLAPVSGGLFAGMQVTKDLVFALYRIGAYITKSRLHVGQVAENFNEKGHAVGDQEIYEKSMKLCIAQLEKFASLNK
ncbi:MAG: NADPH-dependent FMN reductase [Weeksellaceae bacterium]